MEDVIAEQSVSGYFVFCLQVSLRLRVLSRALFFFLYGFAYLNLDFIENNLREFFLLISFLIFSVIFHSFITFTF